MTIKELIKKIDTYNEIAEMMNTDKARLKITIDYSTEEIVDYKSFAKYIRETYIENVAKAILEYKGYCFDEVAHLSSVSRFGDVMLTDVEIYPATI